MNHLHAVGTSVMAVAFAVSCSSWTVKPKSGHSCRVEKGQSMVEVHKACGEPDEKGYQPKAPAPSGPGLLDIGFCCADCDRYGDRTIKYDCGRMVVEVVGLPCVPSGHCSAGKL